MSGWVEGSVSAPECPAHLSEPVAAVWRELAAGSPILGPAFEAYCGQVATLREAQKRVDEEGIVIADPKGNPIPHPALAVARAAQVEIRSWGSKFAATVSPYR